MVSGDVPLVIGSHRFASRLFLGTGKYATNELMRDALDASGTECVTLAVRRVNLSGDGTDAGCVNLTAEVAVPVPVGLFVSRVTDALYLSSSVHDAAATTTTLYRFSTNDLDTATHSAGIPSASFEAGASRTG